MTDERDSRVATRTSGTRIGLAAAAIVFACGLLASSEAAAQDDLLPPGIVHEPCEFYKKRKNFEIVARFYDDSPIFDPKVIYRTRSRRWKSAPFKKISGGQDFKAMLKRRHLKGVLEYFIEVFDENGNGPARYGSPEAPVRVRPSKKKTECIQVPEHEPEAEVEEPTALSDGESSSGGVEEGSLIDDSTSLDSVDGSGETGTGDGSGDGSGLSDGGDGSGTGGDGGPETIDAASGGGGNKVIIAPPPEPKKTGCDADDAPLYCSGVFWGVLGGAVVAAGAAGVGIYFGVVAPGQTEPEMPVIPNRFGLTVSGPSPQSAL